MRNKDGKNKNRIFANTLRLIFKHSISLLFGQCIFIVIALFLLTPFVHYLFDLALSISGYSYITVNNILHFILNPVTFLILFILFLLIGIFFLAEVSFFVTLYAEIESGKIPILPKVFSLTIKRLILTVIHRNFKLIPIVWLSVLFCNIPLVLYIVKTAAIFRYMSKFIVKTELTYTILIILVVLLAAYMFRKIFVFQYCFIEGRNYKSASQLSKNIKKTKALRAIGYLIVWNIGLGIVVYLIRIITMAIIALIVVGIADKSLVIATFISINERMSSYMSIAIYSAGLIANYALLTNLFYQFKKEENQYFYFDNSVESIFLRLRSYKKVIILFCMIYTIVNIYFVYDIIKNDAPFVYVDFDMIKITSHRGFSKDVPENTIPAIEKAIEEQADYIEIDVRQTKDGELVLLHDETLNRTTGLKKYIWNVSYSLVKTLDAGKWMDESYAGTKIPTLREVFELCKGTININLDLKYDNHVDGLEEKVVALIEEYEMESQCVISSMNLSVLENVKALDPEIKTGYITYQIERYYYNYDFIDFFSLNSYFVTEKLLQGVHNSGKEIHVWTVNSKNEIQRMKRLGVDNIITDNPAYTKEMLYQDDSNYVLLTIFKLMMMN